MNALRMIIVPLIMSSIIVGISTLGSGNDLGRLGGKTIVYYAFSSTAAILVGLFLSTCLRPVFPTGSR